MLKSFCSSKLKLIKSQKKRIIFYLLIDLVIAYLISSIILYIFQSNFIYYPTNQDFNFCPGFNDSAANSYNGTRFYELVQSRKLLVFYHGNYGSACDRAPIKDELKYLGYSMLFIEYKGYSNDDQKLSTISMIQDVKNINEYIHLKNYVEIAIAGESVGTCFASYHAKLVFPNKLILISPPTSLIDIAKNKLPIYPHSLLMKENCDNVENLKDYFGNVLIVYGKKDPIVTDKMVERLYSNIPSREKNKVIIENADHNNIYLFDKTWDSLGKYLING